MEEGEEDGEEDSDGADTLSQYNARILGDGEDERAEEEREQIEQENIEFARNFNKWVIQLTKRF